jgi:hypothetical protein
MGLSKRGAVLELCAYSGCQEGRINMRRSLDKVSVMQAWLTPSTQGNSQKTSISVIYDEGEKVAQMRWGGFSNVMQCKPNS